MGMPTTSLVPDCKLLNPNVGEKPQPFRNRQVIGSSPIVGSSLFRSLPVSSILSRADRFAGEGVGSIWFVVKLRKKTILVRQLTLNPYSLDAPKRSKEHQITESDRLRSREEHHGARNRIESQNQLTPELTPNRRLFVVDATAEKGR